MPYDPDTGYFYVPGTIRPSTFVRYGDIYKHGLRYVGGTQAPPIGASLAGTFTAINATTNKIAWQQQMPYRMGGGGGSSVTAGGLLLRGEPDGNFVALDAKTGDGIVEIPNRFRCRCAAGRLPSGRRRVHFASSPAAIRFKAAPMATRCGPFR